MLDLLRRLSTGDFISNWPYSGQAWALTLHPDVTIRRGKPAALPNWRPESLANRPVNVSSGSFSFQPHPQRAAGPGGLVALKLSGNFLL